jgi:RecJ-like exonuclease
MFKKTKAKKCPDCKGNGFITVISGKLSDNGNTIEASEMAYQLCSKCRGTGIVGIKELESLTPDQLAKLVKGKSTESLLEMFNNKSTQEIIYIISSL